MEITKFPHVISALQSEELAIVDYLIFKPPAENPYTTLIARLCSQYSDSEEQRLRNFISGMQLGDLKPWRLLLEMGSKAGNRISDNLLKSFFLQYLPTNVQQILAIFDDGAEKLAEMADGIMAAACSVPSIRAVEAGEMELKTMLMDISSRLSPLETCEHSTSRGGFRRRSADSRNHEHCWYHRRFKERSMKCTKPCSFLLQTRTTITLDSGWLHNSD
ncbi:uncharacterized protein LOC129974930 [Argiope bruennichi]|uniref:uncharacterized protein LOC129974930 n=1 Tax=Argiope bruennichi TaxID=94029 RepID=UPI0024946BE5|nr:uncharacterized protein LOC129974930 [Argiope bruennichi]